MEGGFSLNLLEGKDKDIKEGKNKDIKEGNSKYGKNT
jgi:hypothetical protein